MYFMTTVSHNSTGTKSVPVPFSPKHLRITLSQKGNSADPTNHLSIGDYSLDEDYQVTDATFTDATGSKTQRYTDRIANIFQRVSGAIVEKMVVRVDQVNAPWVTASAPYSVKYIVDTADVNYQLKIEISD